MGWTTTDLLTRIRRDGRLASTDPDYTDAVLLDMATGIMLDRFVPEIIRVRQEYYDRYEDTSIVADQRAYAFSPRAFASVLREVVYIDANSNERPLIPVSYMESHVYANTSSTEPEAYTVEDDKIIPLPTPNSATGTLRMVYEYRPNVLVDNTGTSCMQITSIANIATGVLGGTSPWNGAGAIGYYDIIKGVPPFALVNADIVATTAVTSTSITFTASDLDTTRIAVGDWVVAHSGGTLYGDAQSAVPQIPAVLHTALAKATAAQALIISGDKRGAAPLEAHVTATLGRLASLLSPRVKGKTTKWMNAGSPLRRGRGHSKMVWDDGSA